MQNAEEIIDNLSSVKSIFHAMEKEIASLEAKVAKEKERGDRFLQDNQRLRAKVQYYDKSIAVNDKYRAELKSVKGENDRLLVESNKHKRMLASTEKELVKERERRVKETNQLKRKLNDLEHDTPVGRKATVRNGRSDAQTPETPYKASTTVGKREMVIGYFVSAELAKQAEDEARGIL